MKRLEEMTFDELKEVTKKEGLKFSGNIKEEALREKLEEHFIVKKVRFEEENRQRIIQENKLKADMEEIRFTAEQAKIVLEYPENPTIADVVRLKKQLGLKQKERKPSPETLGIRASKRAYFLFRNYESPGVDVPTNLGGETPIHLFHGKKHCLPVYAVNLWRKNCYQPRYKRVLSPDGKTSRSVEDTQNREPRFTFEYLGDAPDDEKFGVVFSEETELVVGAPTESAP